jgi:hypothetical protein
MKTFLQFNKRFCFVFAFIALIGSYAQAQRTASVTGPWSSTTTWGGQAVPTSADAVTINSGVTVTVDVTANCASITFLSTATVNSTVSINTGITLNVVGAVTIPRQGSNNNTMAVGAGTLNAGSIAFTNGGGGQRHLLTISTGTCNVSGNITQSGSTGSATITFTGAGLLKVAGTFLTAATATFTAGTGTVEYNGAAQTVGDFAYNNLTLSNSGAKTLVTGTSIAGNLTLSGTANTATVATLTIGGNLNIGDGTTFTAAGFALTVTGTTTIGGGTSGNLTTSSATGTKIFTGLVTINAGGTWTNTAANSPVTFRGGITNNGTFSAGTGVYTFDTNSQPLVGTLSIPNVTVTGVTVTNNNTLTVSTALSGSGGVTQAANATLNIGGTSGITTLTASNSGNTVNYTGTAQTVHSNNYVHLALSGSGAKTLQTGTTSITGNLTLSGTVNTTTVAGLTIGGNLLVGDGTTFTAAGFALTVTGTTTVGGGTSGNLTISSATGTKIFTGLVTVNTGGVWNNSGNSPVTFRGGITNNGTFTAGTGVHTFDTNAQALSGSAFTIPSVTVTGVSLTNNNSLTVNTALSGTGSLTQAASATLNIGAASAIAGINASSSGNNVFYTSTTGGQTLIGGTYNNVTLSNSSGSNTANGNVIVNGTMIANAAGGTLSMSTFTLSGAAITNNGTISTQNTSATPIPSGASWGGTINYNAATGGQTIVTGTYTNLTSGNTSGINTAAGNLVINGVLTTTALGTLSLGTNTISGSLTTITNNGTISTANTSGTPLPSGLTWGGTINYNALTGGQTIVVGTYNNLTLSNTSGTSTAGSDLAVNGTLTTTAGGTFDMGTNLLSGGLTTVANNGTTRTANISATPIPAGKTWGGTVNYAGLTAQTVVNGTYSNLTISNTAGASISGAVSVNTALSLSSSLTLGANNLTLGYAGAVAGVSSSVYIVTNSTGQLKRTVGGSAVNFPVGNSAYNPITFTNSGTSDMYGVIVEDGPVTTAADVSLAVNRRWDVTEAVAGGSSLAIVAQYNSGETTADFSTGNPIIGFYNGATWVKSSATYSGGSSPFTFTSTTNLTPADLTTGTQYFALGKDYAFVAGPSQFAVTSIIPNPVISGSGFQVTIESQNGANLASNVAIQTFFNLSTNGNAGPLSGTVAGSIPAGQSSVTLNGVILSALGTGATITATLDGTNGGDPLTPGTSAPFNVVASAASDIIAAGNETPNIDYKTQTGSVINTTSDGIRVWSFNVRDGGGSSDADNLATILSAVTISKGASNTVTSWANTIQEAALFDGTTKVAEITVSGETLVFSSLNGGAGVTAGDNSSKVLDLYLTFKTANITDGQQFQFAITNAGASASPAGSLFNAFTTANSSVATNNNRIQVTASQLVFGAQALTDVAVGTPMTPAFTIRGVDINNNLDINYTSTITLAVSGSTFSGAAPSAAAVAGVATFSPVFATTGTGVTITGSDGAITATPSSNTFNVTNIVPVATDLFRSKTSGNWDQITTWQESHDGTSWFDAAVTPTNANSSSITILNGHTVTIPATLPTLSVDQTTINTGGQITVGNGVTLTINDGTGTDLTANGILSVDGTVVNQASSNIAGTASTILFNANGTYVHNQNGGAIVTATWNINSTCKITGFTNASTTALTNLGQTFGNFVWDCSGQTTALVALQTNGFTGTAGTMTVNRTGTGSIYINSSSTTPVVVGNYTQTGGTVVIDNTTASRTFTVTGNFTLNQNTTTSSFQLATSSVFVSTITLNVGGDFSISAGTLSTGGTANTTNVNFNGTAIQLFSKTGGTISGAINFAIVANAIVNFGTSVLDGSSGTFNLNSGGSIITAHAQGLSTTAATGSIQVTGTKTYNAAANYTYNGIVAQVTGNGLVTANNLTINNSTGVTLSAATTVNGTLALTSGLLVLGANNLTIGAAGSISGVTSSTYVQTNNTGLLRRTVAASPVSFPVGNATYNPITLSNSGTSDIYGVTEIDGAVPNALDATFTVNRRWRVTENTSGGSNLAVVGQYNSGEEAANFGSGIIPKIGFYNGTVWVETAATQAGANPFTFTSNANFTPTNLTTGTQYFALGKDQAFSALPQGTLSGNSICVSGTGQLTFTATSGTSPFTIVYNDGTSNVTQTNVTSGTPFNVSPNPTVTTNYTLVSVTDADGDVRSSGFTGGTATITVSPALLNNTIAANQSICSGTTPAPLTGSLPTGGNGVYAYLWQSSTTSATTGFANAAGTNNGQNYTPPGSITQTTWYRRVVTSGSCTDNSTAIQVTVTTAPTITPGPTLTAAQSCSPVPVTLTGASFGAPATSAAWSIVSGGGTLSTTAFTATPSTVTYTPAPGFSGAATLALTTDACPTLSANRTVNVNAPTVVNYDFNTGASFAALVSNAVVNVTSTAGGTSFATSATGTVTGGSAFTTNSTAGNSLSQTATANNNWTFALTGADVKFYKSFKIYFEGQRNSGSTPQNINLLYSIDGGANFISFGNQPLNNLGSWVEALFTLPVATDNPTSLIIKLNITSGNGTALIDNFQIQGVYTVPADKTPTAAASPICQGTSTNVQIATSQLGVNYQLRNNAGNTNIGSAVAGTGSTINLPTGNLSATTTFNVLASNTCSVQMVNTVTVTVNPLATLSSSLTPPAICSNTAFSYAPTSATPSTTFNWSRSAVVGISNSAASGSGNPNETLINTSATPVSVTYAYTLIANGCTNPTPFNVVVVVNPTPTLTSTLTPPAVCDGNPFQYIPASGTPGTTFSWSRAAVAGISNPAASGTDDPNETLYNLTTLPVNVTYVYTLSANGCANPVTYNVVVTVNASPSAIATDIAVNNTPGVCGATITLGSNVTTNGTLSYDISGTPISNPYTFPIGTTTVTVTASNDCGTSTAFFDVTVSDAEAPVIPVLADVTGECTATATPPVATDNCAGNVTGTTTDPLTYSTQGTFVIHWSFDDGHGNISTATQNVVVHDVTAPVVPVLADVTGECSATATAPTTIDNCFGTITGTTSDPLTYSTQGTFVIHWSFDDGHGNISTATQNVVVHDVTAPVVPVLADVTGECAATATAPTTTDNCSGTITGTTSDPLTYSTQGTHVIHWSFDDGHGNISTVTQNVVIHDVTAPVVPVLPDVTGECSATATAPTTTDNCSGVITGTTSDPLTYSTQGTHVIHWSFDDGNGNISTANQNVVIHDVTAPVVPVLADVTGECTATATAPTTTDNCSGIITGTTSDPLTYSTQGTFVIHWSFDDGNGNISTATQNVVIHDVTAPVVPVLADVTGECTATATAPTTTDNCVGTITGTTSDPLTYSTQGTFVIHWSFDDGQGNISTATQNVVIHDVTAPVVPVLADVTGECSATATEPTTTDNCSGTITGTTSDPLTYSTQGTFVIHWSFDDGHGNISTATQNVVIHDVTAPVVPVLADVTGECSATATAPTTTDNCSGTITGTTSDPLTYSTQGTFVIHWSFDDGHGNISTATQNVVIHDVTAPVVPVLADVTGECTATATAPTTTDNCSGTITGTTSDPLTYSTQGTFVIHWSFDDGNGNISTATQNVVIHDVTAPVVPVLADVTGECTATATAPTTTDNCSGTITGTTSDPLTYSTQGTFVIHWSFDDGNGNISTATQNVVIHDVTAPVVPVLADVTGECTATATAPTTTDNCSGVITGTTSDPLTYSTQGTFVIHWSFDDGNGNISTATQNVVIHDVTAPVVPVLADVTGECSATATAPTTTDNCSGTITGTTSDPLTYSTQGTFVIHWSFDDGHGNISTATQNVVIHDVTAPVVPVLADVIGECTATATAPTTTDNCSGTITGTTSDPLTYSTQGTFVIHWSFDDGHGNISTATQNVVIHDVTAPVVPVLADVTGECSATATAPTTTDNCSGTITGTTSDPLTYSTQGTFVIHWSFDDGHGNISTATQNVVIHDVTAPVVPVLADVTGECTATATAPTTTDNCTGTITGTTSDPLTYSIQGTFVIHWSFDDGHGNISTATQNVVVHDVTAPVVPVLADVTGECSATATAPTTTDNCSGIITGTTSDPLTYSTQGIFVIHWSFDDGHGNISTATQNVVVHDVTAPLVPILADVTGECTASATAPTTTDNCSGNITGTTSDPLTYSTQGTHVIHWSFDDGHGNISTATQNVVIHDVTAPVVPVLADLTGECTVTATAPTTTDNCSGTITGTTSDPLTYSTQGTFVIHWSFDDGHGNISTATQNVVIHDVTAPVVPVLADVTGECTVTATAPTTTDNCSGTITGTTSDPLTYSTQGTFVIHWSFDDGHGNISTATQNVVIHDVTAPVVPVLANVTGECAATATAPTTTDNCSGTITGTTSDPLTYSTQGTFVIHWSFDDGHGNISTATQNVVVHDVTAPVVPVLADVTGECAATATAPTTTDNCSGTITGTTSDPLTYSTQGTHVIHWSFDDGHGNVSTATQNVVVHDVTPPVVTTVAGSLDATLECDNSSGISLALSMAPAATDNCTANPLIHLVSDVTTPDANCANAYIRVRTWNFTDGVNNTSANFVQTITVQDHTPPFILSAPDDVTVDADANCQATNINLGILTAQDNCSSVVTITNDHPSIYPIGTTIVTWTIKDACHNMITYQQTVKVIDHTNPLISNCPTDITVFTGPGATACSKGVTWTPPSASDNCGVIASFTSNYVPGAVFPVGTTLVTYVATDASTNSSTCSFNVTVVDNTAPVISNCPANIVTCNPSVTWTAPTATDNCGVTSFTNNAPASFPVGVTTVTYTALDAAGNTSTCSFTVTVNPTPSAIAASNSPICAGATLSLSAGGGTSYSWSGPNGFSSTLQNPSIAFATTAASGTYTVTVSNGFGCSATATANVVVNASVVATASSNSPVCGGGSLNLTASGGVSYSWTGPNGFASLQQNPTILNVSNAASGIYTVTVTNSAGCTAQASTSVSVSTTLTALAANNGPLCEGATLSLSAAGGVSYSWIGPNGFSSTQQNPTISNVTTAVSGTYTVTVTGGSGCTASTTTNVTVNVAPTANAANNGPVCQGGVLSLSASGGTSYSWSGPNGFSSLQQNPSLSNVTSAAGGIYTVTVTNASGCSSTASTLVSVNASTPAAAASNSPVCVGTTLTLFSSVGSSYSWSGPNGFSSLQQNPTLSNVTSAAGGIYTVTVTNGSGCVSVASTSVVVGAAPIAAASANGPVCEGSLLSLSASGGVSYSWTGPNGFSSTQQNPTLASVPTTATGIYTVIVTNASNCSASASVFVQVNANPVASASSNTPVCAGALLNLFANGGASYSWTGPNGFSSTQQNSSISNASAAAGGTYTVTVTNASGCAATTTTNVTVNNAVVASASSNSPVCTGGLLNLLASGGVTYSWTGPNGFSSTQQNPSISSVSAAASGTYTVTVTNASGCTASTTTTVAVNASSVGGTVSGSTTVCSGSNSGTLTLSGQTGNVIRWEFSTNGGSTWSTISNTTTSQTYTNLTQTTQYQAVVMNGTCASANSVAATITVNTTAVGGTVSGSTTVCTGSNSGTVTLSGQAGTIIKWQFSTNGGSTWTDIANTTTTQTYSNLTQTTQYRAVIGGCTTVNSSAATITVNPASVGGTVSGTTTVCSGSNSGTLTLSGQTGNVIRWEFSTNGGSTWSTISNTTTSQTYTNLTQTTQYQAVVMNGTCASANSAVATISVNAVSVGGTVSGSTTVCTGSNSGTVTLSGQSGTIIKWQFSTNGGSTWTDIANTTTTQTYSNLTQTTQYRAVIGGCSTVNSSAATITVNPASVGGTVSGSATVCSGSNSGTLTLSGQTGIVIRWEFSTNGGSTWSTISNTTTSQTYTNLTQTTQYRAVVQNGTCASANSVAATITVNAASAGGTVSGSTTVCGGTNSGTLTLSGQSGTIIKWQFSTNGGSTWTDIANTTTTQTYSNLTQTTQYRAVIGGCTTVNSSAATITVNPASVGGTVSGSATVCSGSNSGTLTLSGQTGNVIRWEFSTNGGSTWSTISNTTTSQTYSNLTQTRQYRAVVMNGTCASANSAAATITVNTTTAGGSISGSTTVCTGSNSGTLTLFGQAGTIIKWQFSTNGGSTWTDIANTTTTQTYSNLTQTTQYRAVIGGCSTVNSSVAIITVNPASVGGTVSGSATVCSGSNSGTLTLSGQTGSVVRWEFSTNGGSTWSTISNTTTSQTYSNLTQTRQYRAVVMSGVCASANSVAATITVNATVTGGTVSGSTTVCTGSNSGTLTLSGQSGTIVKWQFSTNGGSTWTDIANTTTTQTYSNLTQTRQYRAVIGGCSSTVNSSVATITVGLPPVVTITASNAADEFCNSLVLTASSSLTAQSYQWSNSATTQSIKLGTANAAGNYSVTVVSANGCTGNATYNYNPQAVASSYTILGIDGVSLSSANNVQGGSVGATSSNGTISIGNNSAVASPGAFVKAKNLLISGGANVPTRISSPAVVALPAMQYNTTSTSGLSNVSISNNASGTLNGNYRNVTIGTNCNLTLTGSIFGLITIRAGSTVRFTQAGINVNGITLQQGSLSSPTTLAFSQGSIVRSSGDINVANICSINPDNYKVVFYLGNNANSSSIDFRVAAGGNTTVNASMYLPNGTLAVGGNNSNYTYMNGKFIASQVTTIGQRVIWNSFDCASANLITRVSTGNGSQANVKADIVPDHPIMTVLVTPNPTETYFTLRVQSNSKEPIAIKISDIVGREIEVLNGAVDQTYHFGNSYMQGMYVVEVHQGEVAKVIKVIKN